MKNRIYQAIQHSGNTMELAAGLYDYHETINDAGYYKKKRKKLILDDNITIKSIGMGTFECDVKHFFLSGMPHTSFSGYSKRKIVPSLTPMDEIFPENINELHYHVV